MKYILLLLVLVLVGCSDPFSALQDDINRLQDQNTDLSQQLDSLKEETRQIAVRKVLVTIDTIIVNDSLFVVDSVFRYDTTYIKTIETKVDSVFQYDSTYLKHVVLNVDSVHSYDTVYTKHTKSKIDSVVIIDSLIKKDTLVIKDSVIKKDTIVYNDTLSTKDTVYNNRGLEVIWTSADGATTPEIALKQIKNGVMMIEFNNKIDQLRTGYDFITLTSDNPNIYYDPDKVSTRWVGSSIFQFEVNNFWRVAESITVTIGQNVYDVAGSTLSEPKTVSFSFYPEFKFLGPKVFDESVGTLNQDTIELSLPTQNFSHQFLFSHDVFPHYTGISGVADYFESTLQLRSTSYDRFYIDVLSYPDFKLPVGVYYITIKKGLKNVDGYELKKDHHIKIVVN